MGIVLIIIATLIYRDLEKHSNPPRAKMIYVQYGTFIRLICIIMFFAGIIMLF